MHLLCFHERICTETLLATIIKHDSFEFMIQVLVASGESLLHVTLSF